MISRWRCAGSSAHRHTILYGPPRRKSNMSNRYEKILSTIIVLAIVAMATAFVHRQFAGTSGSVARRPIEPPKMVETWQSVAANGISLGDPTAPVRIIEFSDLECPFCQRFHTERWPALQREFGRNISLTFMHFPLSSHRFAMPGARAAECAAKQGRFAEYVEAVFRQQDSLGLKTWAEYARDAGVPDSTAFLGCVASKEFMPRIDSGRTIGARLGVDGTPAIMINGWLFDIPPSDSLMAETVRALLAGKKPF